MKYHTIVVDGCNNLFSLYNPKVGFNFSSVCKAIRTNCRRFFDVLSSQADNVYIVFDVGQRSTETKAKWLSRRKREVETEQRNMPLNILYIIIDIMTQEQGSYERVKVVTPNAFDADDYIAAIAHEEGVGFPEQCIAILSQDTDYARYDLPPNVHMCKLAYLPARKVQVMQWTPNPKQVLKKSARPIPAMLIEQGIDLERDSHSMLTMYRTPESVRGTSDSRVKTHKSLYEVTDFIRAEAYWRLATEEGCEEAIEQYMVWDEAKKEAQLVTKTISIKDKRQTERDTLRSCDLAYRLACMNDPYNELETNPHTAERAFARCAVLAEAACAYFNETNYTQRFGMFWKEYLKTVTKHNETRMSTPMVQKYAHIQQVPNSILIAELKRRTKFKRFCDFLKTVNVHVAATDL